MMGAGTGHVPVKAIAFGAIDDERYEESFSACLLSDSQLARNLQVDGSQYILRADLLKILPRILGREPTKNEFDIFFTRFDFDSSCVMAKAEYQRACASLKVFCQLAGQQRQWNALAPKGRDALKNKRLTYTPQDSLVGSVTESQTVGWHAVKPRPLPDNHRPVGSTDVTKREGRSLADYYGTYTLIGIPL